MGDLQCFFTKHSMAEACLGLPLRYSMNPKTQQLDYIEAGLDLVSLDAVHSGWVVESPDGQEIQACLPVYLSFEHFERVKVKSSQATSWSALEACTERLQGLQCVWPNAGQDRNVTLLLFTCLAQGES